MEQGRVNDAARVGQSADLVVAPLFLLCFFFFLSAAPFVVFLSLRAGLSQRFLYFFVFFVHSLWVSSVFYGIMLLHIHMMSHNISFSVPPQCVLWQ